MGKGDNRRSMKMRRRTRQAALKAREKRHRTKTAPAVQAAPEKAPAKPKKKSSS